MALVISLGINFLFFLVNMANRSRFTMSFKLMIQSVAFIIGLIALTSDSMLKFLVLGINLIILFGTWYLNRYVDYDMNKDIISLSLFKNRKKNENIKNVRKIGTVEPWDESEVRYNGAMTYQTDKSAQVHTLVAGNTGSGKSYMIRALTRQDIDNGKSLIFADYKGSPDTNYVIDYAKKHGYKLFIMNNGMSDFNYDPFQNMNPSMLKEALMSTQKWESSYYESVTDEFLNETLQKFYFKFSRSKDKSNFLTRYYDFIKEYGGGSTDGRRNAETLIKFFITSSLGNMFKGEMNKTLDFYELSKSGDKFLFVIYFSPNNKNLAEKFTSLIIKDTMNIYESNPTYAPFIYADETSSLDNFKLWVDLIERGRSSGMGTLLSLQSLTSIKISDATVDQSIERLLTSMKTKIFLAGSTPSIAQHLKQFTFTPVEEIMDKLNALKQYKTAYMLSSDNGVYEGSKEKEFIVRTYSYNNSEVEKNGYKGPDYIKDVEIEYNKVVSKRMEETDIEKEPEDGRYNQHGEKYQPLEDETKSSAKGSSLTDFI